MNGELILDTNILIDHFRQTEKFKNINTQFSELVKNYSLKISAISITEIWSGKSMDNLKVYESVIETLKLISVLEATINLYKLAGEIRRRSNYSLSTPDALIASTAIDLNIPLLTLNKKHFENIANLKLLDLKSGF